MKLKVERKKQMPRIALLLALLLIGSLTLPGSHLGWLGPTAHAASFTVTNTDDSGAGSLRQAILDANASPGADTITFNIPGGGVKTIAPASALPSVTDPVVIDGYTQPGASANTLAAGNNAVLLIELDGTNAPGTGPGNVNGITLSGDNNTVRGLVINRFNRFGIEAVEGSDGNVIIGNFIGTDAAGTADLGNVAAGIFLFRSSNDRVGGTSPADRNLVSGNNRGGVELSQGSGGLVIQGNYVGTNAAGTAALGNSGSGIAVGSDGVLIGGAATGAGNLISGNGNHGIEVFGGSNRTIQGNLTGTNAAGTAAIPNGGNGIEGNGSGLLIGGTTAAERNVISGNTQRGINLSHAPNAIVQGNYIGVAADGVTPVGNGSRGVSIGFIAGGFFFGGPTLIGGTTTGAGNVIANNSQPGVLIECCAGQPSTLQGNSIFANGGLGIEFGPGGPNPNDQGDADGGTNDGQNFPVLTAVSNSGGNPTIQGTLNSVASTTFRVEFFSNSACDPSGHGEGRNFLGSTNLTTDAGGNAAINAALPAPVAGGFITSTATRLDGAGNAADTSEFSMCLAVTPPMAGQLQFSSGTYAAAESSGSVAVTVTRTGGSDGAVTVDFATANGTAAAGSDYTAAAGTLTFAAGETSRTFAVPILDDGSAEGVETINLTLSNPTGGAALGGQSTALITVADNDAATLQFSAANYTFSEGAACGNLPGGATCAVLTVTRAGDAAGAATVFYRTVDDPAAVRCDDNTTLPGTAFARCDYATSLDTLTFAPGETSKAITIPLIDDAHVENDETLQVVLSNPTAAALGGQTTATATITDNDTAGRPNPILSSPSFVRMQYLDFLSREPEAGGFNAWLNLLDGCPDAFNLDAASPSAQCDRILVSSSFFRSPEFQLKGYFVYRFYVASLNRRPAYEEIVPDMRAVTGQTPEEVFQKRAAFADAWVARQEFRDRYDALSNTAFVDALLNRYNAAQITAPDPANPDGTQTATLTRAELAGRLNASTLTRAQVVRALVESREVNDAEFNGAFVAMQYYGYLRRTPEEDGYQAWLRYLNANPSDFRTMVNGFVNSIEYRLRFGTP